MAGRGKFDPARHPRDRFGRFTKSRTVRASAKDKAAARAALDGFTPKQTGDGKAYLAGIQPEGQQKTAGNFALDAREINQDLRAGHADAAGVAPMDAAMAPLPDDVVLSRTVPQSAFGALDVTELAGMKVRDAGFTSTQYGTAPATADVRMHIAAPAGTRAVINPDTGEVVLDRDLEMVVAKVEPNTSGGHDMFLTVLPKQGAQPAGERGGEADHGNGRADLMTLKVADLQAKMRERGLRPGRKRKSQMVDELVADETGTDTPAGDHEPTTAPPVKDTTGLLDHIPRLVSALAERPGDLVSLVRLRDELGDADRTEVDAALLHLSRQRVIQLDPDPDRRVLSARAKAAAIQLGGEDMHLVSVKPPVVDNRRASPVRSGGVLGAAPLDLAASPRQPAMTNRMYRALAAYRDADYSAINDQLRGGGDTPAVSRQIAAMDEAMQASSLRSDVQLFRGLADARSMFGDRVGADLTGMQWREDAFVSASADEKVARRFAEDGLQAGSPMVMQMMVPKGTSGVAMTPIEFELLLDRGHTFEVVTDLGIRDGVRVVEVAVAPKPPVGP